MKKFRMESGEEIYITSIKLFLIKNLKESFNSRSQISNAL
jgi:hypothetical protein